MRLVTPFPVKVTATSSVPSVCVSCSKSATCTGTVADALVALSRGSTTTVVFVARPNRSDSGRQERSVTPGSTSQSLTTQR